MFQAAFVKVIEKLQDWLTRFIAMLPNLTVAILVLLVAAVVGKLAAYWTRALLRRLRLEDAAAHVVGRLVQLSALGGGLTIALSVLQLEKAVTSLLAGIGIVSLAVGFAFQDLAANLVAGMTLSMRHRFPFQVGDLIDTNEVLGVAEEVHLRYTVIRTLDGHAVLVPNRRILESKLTNYTSEPYRRVDVPCRVSLGEDLRAVKRIALEVLEPVEARLPDRPVQFYWTGYGEGSVDFVARFWIRFRKETDYLEARSEAVMRIKAAFNRHGITIPFPIRTLDFGIKGGEKLRQMWPVRVHQVSAAVDAE